MDTIINKFKNKNCKNEKIEKQRDKIDRQMLELFDRKLKRTLKQFGRLV